MSYVVSQPHSASNPTHKFRVIEFEEWLAWQHKPTTPYPKFADEFSTSEAAYAYRDKLNSEQLVSQTIQVHNEEGS